MVLSNGMVWYVIFYDVTSIFEQPTELWHG